jgi:two-component system sensor histidine kinase/response regulator
VPEHSILIVDDTPENLDVLDEILRGDYRIKVAVNGRSALKIAESTSPPDLILLDIMMPEMDGYEVLQRLKAEPKTSKIPVIFITAKSEPEDEKRGLELGAVDYITKPISPAIVSARVKNHLELKLAREELEKQNEQLKAMLQIREDMANMIVHDMRTPLASIMSFAELLAMKNGVLPEYLKYLQNIQTQANRLNSFLNDMLVLAKTEKTQLLLNRSPVDLRQMAETVVNMYSGMSRLKQISLVMELPPEDGQTLSLDGNLFQRVLDNLVSNALKFAPTESKIILHIQYPENGAEKKPLRIQVIDEGPGIPPEQRERLFNKFAIVEMKRKGVQQVGLGLAFCKMVVDAHGGRIFVTDNHPKGSIFNIEI